jgi:hypothetical protein
MARNFSGKISELLKITATLALAGQIITEKEHRPTGADSDRRGEIPRTFSLVDPNWKTYTMATAAQIEANRDSQRSTGPQSDKGKARVRRNALKHGLAAFTIMPTLPRKTPNDWMIGLRSGSTTCNRGTPSSAT